MSNQHRVLAKFCYEIQEALDFVPGDRPSWFFLSSGLCDNFIRWCHKEGYDEKEIFQVATFFCAQLYKEKSGAFPFNFSREDYQREVKYRTLYHNSERLAFIEQWAAFYDPSSRHTYYIFCAIIGFVFGAAVSNLIF